MAPTEDPATKQQASRRLGLHSNLRRLVRPFATFAAISALSVIIPQAATAQQDISEHQAYCLSLESKLARLMQGGGAAKVDRAKLRSNIRNVERVFHRLNNDAERYNCYSYFLFSKELRRTSRCVRIDRKIRDAKRQLARMNDELHRAANSRSDDKYRQDELISALARNKCGRQYEREASKRNSFESWFNDGFFGGGPRERSYSREDQFKFATHRTLCVRLCDGYYFPVSFATTPNRFRTDASLCQSRCAAPAELYTHPNPGGEAEQMISVEGSPYEKLKNAFRFRKEFVKGCSCKPQEYDPELLAANQAKENQPPAAKDDEKAQPPVKEEAAKEPEADKTEEKKTATN